MIARTGFYIEDYNSELGVSKEIIRTCFSKGLIRKGRTMFFYKKLTKPYFLTDISTKLVKELFSINPYKFKATQGNHDFLLCQIYLSLSEEEKDSWVTETTLDMMHPGESVPDGMFISPKYGLAGVEVLTNNYTEKKKLY